MKNSGGKDTFLLFIVLLLALGAVCWLCVIQKNFDKLSDVKDELRSVQQEKAQKDAIIQQAEQLDKERQALRDQLINLENKYLPDLVTSAIQRKLFKHFEDAKIPFIVEISNTPLNYDVVTMTDGKISPNRIKSSRYKISVSGTDGWLLTHDEEIEKKIPYSVFYSQISMNNPDPMAPNPIAQKYGFNNANDVKTETYVGFNEFVAALQAIEQDAKDYVKIAEINIEDTKQGFCTYTAAIDVYAYELVDRISPADNQMNYMTWVGAENIKTGGLVGLPSYFVVAQPDKYGELVAKDSPLYGRYISFISYDFSVNRPFAAWSHWGYEWNYLDQTFKDSNKLPPYLAQILIEYKTGMIDTQTYNALYNAYVQENGGGGELPQQQTTNPEDQQNQQNG
ncbi:MAG: hypothetical protein J6Y58_02335 [Clostridiales bacterium]|nr:hypothetical protein [Clostridiales bacterium]